MCALQGHSSTVENGASSLSMPRKLGTSKTCAKSHSEQWLGFTIAGSSPRKIEPNLCVSCSVRLKHIECTAVVVVVAVNNNGLSSICGDTADDDVMSLSSLLSRLIRQPE